MVREVELVELVTAWDNSYDQGDNLLFAPMEEIVRFVNRWVVKRLNQEDFKQVHSLPNNRILDLGCGGGRHLVFLNEMGLEAFGVDHSQSALNHAKKLLESKELTSPAPSLHLAGAENLPFDNGFFSLAVSHGTLDSMPFEDAQKTTEELFRVMIPGGLAYLDLIGTEQDDFDGELVLGTLHEQNTVQSYFTLDKIKKMLDEKFDIRWIQKRVDRNLLDGTSSSRFHIVVTRNA